MTSCETDDRIDTKVAATMLYRTGRYHLRPVIFNCARLLKCLYRYNVTC